jgi:hypothetical protein
MQESLVQRTLLEGRLGDWLDWWPIGILFLELPKLKSVCPQALAITLFARDLLGWA